MEGLYMSKQEFETHKRSMVKAISWRFFSFWIIIAITYLLTGEVVLSFSVGTIDFFIKIGAYYFHERIWCKVRYGRIVQQFKEGGGI